MLILRKLVVLCLFLFVSLKGSASDSLQYFTFRDFFAYILANHPVARQADLLPESAKQEIRIARGFFDPTIESKYYEKEYGDKHYFTVWNSYLRIPTWYGVDIQAGFERNSGPFVNSENVTPPQGLTYLGLSVPIGQGMLLDQRRAAIQQAKQLPLIAESERVKIINKLLLQAGKDYWDWMYYYNKYALLREGYELASIRFQAVKERAELGDLSTIDTVEALMQVQNYEVLLRQSEVEYQNARLFISTYLWNSETAPLELDESILPSMVGSETEALTGDSLSHLVEIAQQNHPDLVKLNAKLSQLKIEKRYAANQFLPKINLQYNFLQTGSPFNPDAFNNPFVNNYKYGVSFSYPLFLRKERGKYKLADIKMQQTNYEIQETDRLILNEIQRTANEWTGYENQIRTQERVVQNAEALRTGELIRFQNGESSLFLINSRENYLITNQIKLYELRAKYAKTKIALQWASGTMVF